MGCPHALEYYSTPQTLVGLVAFGRGVRRARIHQHAKDSCRRWHCQFLDARSHCCCRLTPRPSFRISAFRNPSPADTAMADLECGKGQLAGAGRAQQAGPLHGGGGSSPPASDLASTPGGESDWDDSSLVVRQQAGWTSVRSDSGSSPLVQSSSLGACLVPSAPPASGQGSAPLLDAPAPSLGDDADADVAGRRADADVVPRRGQRVSWRSGGRGAAAPQGKEVRARAQEETAPAGMTAAELARARWRRWETVRGSPGGGGAVHCPDDSASSETGTADIVLDPRNKAWRWVCGAH